MGHKYQVLGILKIQVLKMYVGKEKNRRRKKIPVAGGSEEVSVAGPVVWEST